MKTFKMMRSEYLCWLFNSRIILLPCVFIIVYTMITSDLVKCANNMCAPINLLEPFIGICNSATFLGFIPIVFLVLIADFPRIDNNMIFKIYRAGRIKWVLSQLLFLLAADVTFVFLLFVGITLPILQRGFWFNGWSDVVTDMSRVFPELADSDISKFIPANLYYQMLPFRAAILSSVFLILYLYLIGMIMLVIKIHGQGTFGIVIPGLIVIAGSGLVQLGHVNAKWLLPAAHGIVRTHYSTYYRHMDCTLTTSFLYFFGIIGILLVLVLIQARKINYTNIIQVE